MSTFPQYHEIGYAVPSSTQLQFKTIISQFDDQGKEKRRRKWLYPKRLITIQYNRITSAEAKTIWDFYVARQGSYSDFSFYMKDPDSYTGEYVGTGDGTTVLFSLPSKEAVDYVVYVDSQEKTDVSDYTFTNNDGADGSDKIVFTVAPPQGDRITYDFNGTLRIKCRFKEDFMDLTELQKRLTSIGIPLQGLLIDE